MSNKTLTIGAAAFTAVIVTAGFAVSSFASQGTPSVQGVNNSPVVQSLDVPVATEPARHGGGGCGMAEGRVHGGGQCEGKNGSGLKGQNDGGNFIDANGDGVCDKMQ